MRQKNVQLNFQIIMLRSDFFMFKKLKYKKDFSKMKNLFEKGDFQNTIKCADSILEYDKNNVEVLKYKYNSLTNLELYDDALDCVNKIMDLEPSGMALVNKGTTLCLLENYEEGFRILDDVIENYPEYEMAFLNKGNFLYDLGNFDELLDLSDWFLGLHPNCSSVYDVKASVFIRKEDFESALKCIEDALYYNPEYEIAIERKEYILSELERK